MIPWVLAGLLSKNKILAGALRLKSMNTLSVRLRLATPVIIILPLLGLLRLRVITMMRRLVVVMRIMIIIHDFQIALPAAVCPLARTTVAYYGWGKAPNRKPGQLHRLGDWNQNIASSCWSSGHLGHYNDNDKLVPSSCITNSQVSCSPLEAEGCTERFQQVVFLSLRNSDFAFGWDFCPM